MTLQMVLDLKFARQKWASGHANLSNEDAQKRVGDANALSWLVGHLAWLEHLTWVEFAQGQETSEYLSQFTWNSPASVPPLDEVMAVWESAAAAADTYLDDITEADLDTMIYWGERPMESVGSMIKRQTWHYWYHLGEAQAVRQVMEHKNLPPFIGQMDETVSIPAKTE